MIFEPFFDYGTVENIEKKLDEIFTCQEFPVIEINGNTLPRFQYSGGAGYLTTTLTQHIVFMLSQPSSLVLSGNIISEDTAWFYWTRQLVVPAYLSGTQFEPCYIWQCLPVKLSSVFTDKAQQFLADVEITLSPKYLFRTEEQTNLSSERASALELAYRLCLPGSQVIAVIDSLPCGTAENCPPQFDLKILYRVSKRLRQCLRERNENKLSAPVAGITQLFATVWNTN